MMFGALGNCPLCSGSMPYSRVDYRCDGYLSAWSKCSYSTTDPICLRGNGEVLKKQIVSIFSRYEISTHTFYQTMLASGYKDICYM